MSEIKSMRRADAPPLIPTKENPYTGNSVGFFMPWEQQMRELDYARVMPPGLAISEADRLRLVEASKSPTEQDQAETQLKIAAWEARCQEMRERNRTNREMLAKFDLEPLPRLADEPHERTRQITPLNQAGCSTVIEYREWAEEWRVRSQVDPTSGNKPPEQGERESIMLSDRGARKIAESCEYMAQCQGGYKTFVTGTFNQDARDKIARGDTTIQREVSRCMDAMQKLYQRGFESHGQRVEAHPGASLPYCWVVEVPLNEAGEENPHVHMLLGWQVPYKHFAAWSKRIERIWQHGYFHLEKIHDSACAGAYMAKAAGYLTKSQGQADQGKVKGNRYGISSDARAPAWVKIGSGQLHAMGQLISDIYDHLTHVHGEKYRQRKRLKKLLDKTPKEKRATRIRIGERLQKVRQELKAVPIRCNRYQVILKGQMAAMRFFTWAATPDYTPPVDWLPEKPEGVYWEGGKTPGPEQSHYFRALKKKFMEHKWKRQAATDEQLEAISEYEARCRQQQGTFEDYQEYEQLGTVAMQ